MKVAASIAGEHGGLDLDLDLSEVWTPKCLQCDFTSSWADGLRRHLRKSHTNAASATLFSLLQALGRNILKRTVEKSQTCVTKATLNFLGRSPQICTVCYSVTLTNQENNPCTWSKFIDNTFSVCTNNNKKRIGSPPRPFITFL